MKTLNQVCEQFIDDQSQASNVEEKFSKTNDKILKVCLRQGEGVFIKHGSMIAYEGKVSFERKGHGIGKKIKASLAGEKLTTVFARAETDGVVYLADGGMKIISFFLGASESIVVESHHVLAFDKSVEWEIVTMKSVGALMSSGIFSLKFKGPGYVAVLSNHDPLVLPVRANAPVHTDPSNTVLWSGNLEPSLSSHVGLKSILGYGSGEEFQMKFQGSSGYVMVQSGAPPSLPVE